MNLKLLVINRIALIIILSTTISVCYSADILMVTMGGTKSHKIPFWELAKGLIGRGHNITFLSGFTADFSIEGLQEITPTTLVQYIQNYTNWDLLGRRMRGEMPIQIWDGLRYGWESCEALLEDSETKDLLSRKFSLLILDGAFPECALGIQYKMNAPFMYINTVGFFTTSIARAGSPAPYAITPSFIAPFTDNMNFIERVMNSVYHIMLKVSHSAMVSVLQTVVRKHLGDDVPYVYDISKNVSFILQNGHATVSYPRPFMPNVAEIACIHCHPAKPLPKDLEDFIAGSGDAGFIYVSMGSSVKAVNMPEHLRLLLVNTFAKLPYRVLWKYEANQRLEDLPPNVKIGRWLPQQDILGHKKIRAFVTHGGLLSMFETVYHGVPVVTMPVFCDHDSNSAKAELDGYALQLDLRTLTADKLLKSVHKVINEPKYKKEAKYRQRLIKDQRTTPLETAIYWTEYVIRNGGAYHLQTPGRHFGFLQYYSLDVLGFFVAILISLRYFVKRYFFRASSSNVLKLKMQ